MHSLLAHQPNGTRQLTSMNTLESKLIESDSDTRDAEKDIFTLSLEVADKPTNEDQPVSLSGSSGSQLSHNTTSSLLAIHAQLGPMPEFNPVSSLPDTREKISESSEGTKGNPAEVVAPTEGAYHRQLEESEKQPDHWAASSMQSNAPIARVEVAEELAVPAHTEAIVPAAIEPDTPEMNPEKDLRTENQHSSLNSDTAKGQLTESSPKFDRPQLEHENNSTDQPSRILVSSEKSIESSTVHSIIREVEVAHSSAAQRVQMSAPPTVQPDFGALDPASETHLKSGDANPQPQEVGSVTSGKLPVILSEQSGLQDPSELKASDLARVSKDPHSPHAATSTLSEPATPAPTRTTISPPINSHVEIHKTSMTSNAGEALGGLLPNVENDIHSMNLPSFTTAVLPSSSSMSVAINLSHSTSTVPRSFSGISDQITAAITTTNENEIEVRLDPEELGRLRIVLGGREGSMNVTVFSERTDVLELLKRNSNLLETHFSDAGYEDASFSFEKEHQEAPHEDIDDHSLIVIDAPELSNAKHLHNISTDTQLDLRL
ncbi:MAG: flagellar hook-length control protein FliK [Litoreibacter sp.]|uniref:flagellar hook-length control protein FliK n=1 Tax=Litoreibacter sp. TaxID=1969459 RepID=UPI00329821AF